MKNVKSLEIISVLVSFILSPWLLIPVMFFLILLNEPLSQEVKLKSAVIFYFFGVIPILSLFLYLLKTRRITDWEITRREERYLINIVGLLLGTLVIGLMWFLQSGKIITVTIMIWGVFVFFMGVTFIWKISAHAAASTLFTLVVSSYYKQFIPWGVLIVILVGWSRIRRKKHKLTQVIAGILISIFIFLVIKAISFIYTLHN